MRKVVIFIFGSLLLASCFNKGRYIRTIKSADSLMDVCQDSALPALRLLDSMRPYYSEFSTSEQMHYQLIYAKGMNKGYVDFTSDSVMKSVVEYYDKHGSANDKMLANYLLGCVYRDLKDIPASLEYYLQAVELADTADTSCDYKTLTRIYAQIGETYLKQRMSLNAMKAYMKEEKYAWMTKDTLTALIAYERQANVYEQLDDLEKVIQICDSVYVQYRKHGYEVKAARCLGLPIQSLILTKQYAKAQKYMDIYEKESGYFAEHFKYISYSSFYYCKGLYFLDLGLQRDSAQNCFQKSVQLAHDDNDKSIGAYGWIEFYQKYPQVDSLKKYSEVYAYYMTHVMRKNETEKMLKINALYDYSRWQNAAKIKELENQRANVIVLFVILAAILILVTTLICGYLFYKKNQKERIIRKEQVLFVKQQIVVKKKELVEEQRLLEKSKKAYDKVSARLLEKEEAIERLKNEIEALGDRDAQNENQDKEMFSQKAIVIKFKQLADKEHLPTTQQWEVLERVFESFFCQFKQIVECNRKLNENEYHICMLVWLGFAPYQVKSLMGMSSSNLSNIRKRLGFKIFNKDMSASKFDREIQKISLEDFEREIVKC